VVRVLAIRDASAAGPPIAYGYATDATAASPERMSPPPPVQPGVNTREVRVRADFALGK
jgi:uncharacterized protein YggE